MLFVTGESVSIPPFLVCLNNHIIPNFVCSVFSPSVFFLLVGLFRCVLQCLLTLYLGVGCALSFIELSLCILGLHFCPLYCCFIFLSISHLVHKFFHCDSIIHPRNFSGGGIWLSFFQVGYPRNFGGLGLEYLDRLVRLE